MARPIQLIHTKAPGDTVVMTGLVRDLALTYPGQYEVHVQTNCGDVWRHNPHIAGYHNKPVTGTASYRLDYGPYIRETPKTKLHFLTAFHRSLAKLAKIQVPVLYPRPDLHLSAEEKARRPIAERYWYILSGGKPQFTAKIWSATRCQEVVDILRYDGLHFIQGGAAYAGHRHPPLSGVLNLIGKCSIRDMIWLIYHAEGAIVPITCAMHVAAALEKPCVVIAGGREHVEWEAYTNTDWNSFGPRAPKLRVPHRFLHTQNLLPCCMGKGCWKDDVEQQNTKKRKSLCTLPVDDGTGQIIPKCLEMITTAHVVAAVRSYYTDGTIK